MGGADVGVTGEADYTIDFENNRWIFVPVWSEEDVGEGGSCQTQTLCCQHKTLIGWHRTSVIGRYTLVKI
uniref:Uncharacterized protein n=1 Tax=Arion vulgaris TaxID=1028688 RepID=A0A0B6ZI04_9EUPU